MLANKIQAVFDKFDICKSGLELNDAADEYKTASECLVLRLDEMKTIEAAIDVSIANLIGDQWWNNPRASQLSEELLDVIKKSS